MNARHRDLRILYEPFIRNLCVFVSNELTHSSAAQPLGIEMDGRLLITSAMALICTAGVAFYLRFLVALWKECKPRWLAFSKHLRPVSGGHSAPILRPTDNHVARHSAVKLTKINLNALLEESRKETL